MPHPLHVVSNSPEFFVRKVLTQLELIDCFKSIITPCKSNAVSSIALMPPGLTSLVVRASCLLLQWIAKPSAAWFSFITSAFSSHALSELVVFEDMKETVVECGKRGVRAHLINCEHTVEHAIRLQLATPRRPIAFQYLEFTKPLVRKQPLHAAGPSLLLISHPIAGGERARIDSVRGQGQAREQGLRRGCRC